MKNHILYILAGLLVLLFCLWGVDAPESHRGTSYRSPSYRLPAERVTTPLYQPGLPDTVAGRSATPPAIHAYGELPAARGNDVPSAYSTVMYSMDYDGAHFDVAVLHGRDERTGEDMSSTPVCTGIETAEMHPLEMGMVNVTKGHSAYRIEFPGTGVAADMKIMLPYDEALLPGGFDPSDIQTYCYDRKRRSWVAVPRDSVDVILGTVCSRMELYDDVAAEGDGGSGEKAGLGGLDFINGVIKTPEMPETSAFTPTGISELKAANPMEGITLMQPPSANSNGTASMSYPLDIPAGRQGMQPSLALTYSSGGGNGILGVGWDLPIPEITVETRWGVPRYDPNYESEVYLLNGEQLLSRNGTGQLLVERD